MNTTTVKPASEKQIAFLESLRASRTPHIEAAAVKAWAEQAGSKAVSAKIDELKAMPKAAPAKGQQHAEEPADGIYYVPEAEGPGHIFKVYKMVHGSGRQGCKRLVHDGDQEGRFEYMGLAVKHLPVEAKAMSLEEAKAFGRLYGFCVRCGRTLTDEESIAAGIGPVCSGKWA